VLFYTYTRANSPPMKGKKIMTQTATLTFKTNTQANSFAIAWTRKTFTGSIVGSGTENVSVTVYDVDDSKKNWIDAYVTKMNKGA